MRMHKTPCIITPCMQCRRVTCDPRDNLRGDIGPSWNLCRKNFMTHQWKSLRLGSMQKVAAGDRSRQSPSLMAIKRSFNVYLQSCCRGEKSLFFFWMRHLMPSLGSSAQKMIFLLYGPNFLLFPKEEKEKSCNNLKMGGEIFG